MLYILADNIDEIYGGTYQPLETLEIGKVYFVRSINCPYYFAMSYDGIKNGHFHRFIMIDQVRGKYKEITGFSPPNYVWQISNPKQRMLDIGFENDIEYYTS